MIKLEISFCFVFVDLMVRKIDAKDPHQRKLKRHLRASFNVGIIMIPCFKTEVADVDSPADVNNSVNIRGVRLTVFCSKV